MAASDRRRAVRSLIIQAGERRHAQEPAADESAAEADAEAVTDEGPAADEPVAEADTPSNSATAESDGQDETDEPEQVEAQEEEE